jgi:hypothetical protein
MEIWGVAFLGIIALSSVVQAVFLLGVAREGRRLSQRLDSLQDRIEREIKPTLDQVARISRNFGEVSDIVVLQARRIDDVLVDTLEKVEATTAILKNFITRPLGPLADIMAFLKGLRRGLDVYRQLGGFDSARRGSTRAYGEDEHLFI